MLDIIARDEASGLYLRIKRLLPHEWLELRESPVAASIVEPAAEPDPNAPLVPPAPEPEEKDLLRSSIQMEELACKIVTGVSGDGTTWRDVVLTLDDSKHDPAAGVFSLRAMPQGTMNTVSAALNQSREGLSEDLASFLRG